MKREKTTVEKTAAEKATVEKAADEKITAEKITAEKITAEKTAAEKTTVKKAAAEKTTEEMAAVAGNEILRIIAHTAHHASAEFQKLSVTTSAEFQGLSMTVSAKCQELPAAPSQEVQKQSAANAGAGRCRVAGNEDLTVAADTDCRDGITAVTMHGAIRRRENAEGYPDSFLPENSLELVLRLKGKGEFLAITQHKAWWTRPVFGHRAAEIPGKTQLLIWRTEGGTEQSAEAYSETEQSVAAYTVTAWGSETEAGTEQSAAADCGKAGVHYHVFLAVCDDDTRADLSGGEEELRVSLSSLRGNRRKLDSLALVCGEGKDPYQLLHRCVDRARVLLGNRFRMLEERILPDFMEGLGWCTWDSLGQNVSEQAILDKMDEFQKLGIPVSYVLIDDGWSWVNQETLKLRGFDADPVRFPGGIAQTVRLLKNRYHVKKIGVWQALKGYWYGIEDGSPAYLETAPYLQRYGDGEITVRPAADASFGFWNRWHDYLSRSGIDFIKVDGQGSLPTMLKGDSQKEEAMRSLYRGLEASAALHFHGNLINCMGMAPENVWNRSYSALSRSSDDYTPTISGSIVEHVMQNCYDNVWQGDLYLGDWDMFWSEHEEGAYSAMLRALSGGPVYISDALGHTRTDILSRLTDSDGRILSCEAVARLALDCLTRDPLRGGGILKICNTCRGAGYLGCFTWDLPGETVCEEIRWEDLPARLPAPSRGSVMQKVPAEKAERYLVYDPEKQTLGRCAPGLPFRIEMGARQARILELVPEEDGLTVLGLAEKYIPGAAIESVYRQGNQVQITVTDGGRLAAACSGEPEKVLVNGLPASFEREGELIVIHVPEKGRVTVMLRQ